METHDGSLIHSLEAATLQYESDLTDSSEALEYLSARGLDAQAARTARLGVCSTPLPGHEQFQGMICIPYQTPTGVAGFKFRRMDGGLPKYNSPLGQRTRLYNVLALSDATDTVCIAEGEFDAMVLSFMCGVPCVGVSGSHNWKPHYPRVLRGFQNILIVTDNDDKESGKNAGQELAARIIGDLPNARNVLLPTGMDLNEFYLLEGKDAVLRRLGVSNSPN